MYSWEVIITEWITKNPEQGQIEQDSFETIRIIDCSFFGFKLDKPEEGFCISFHQFATAPLSKEMFCK